MHRSLNINELWKKKTQCSYIKIEAIFFENSCKRNKYLSSFLFESSSLNEEDQWNGQNTLINIDDNLFYWTYNEEVLFKPY